MNSKKFLKLKQKKGWPYWFPRVSILFFIFILVLLISDDFLSLLKVYPVLYNFFVAVLVLSVLIISWDKEGKKIGITFICIGLIYFFIMQRTLIWTNVIFVSLWLILTGFLFFLDRKEKYL